MYTQLVCKVCSLKCLGATVDVIVAHSAAVKRHG